MIQIVCGWCQKIIHEGHLIDGAAEWDGTTHTICDACRQRELERMYATTAEEGGP